MIITQTRINKNSTERDRRVTPYPLHYPPYERRGQRAATADVEVLQLVPTNFHRLQFQ